VRMRHIGRRDGLRPEILGWFDLAAEVTAANQGLNLNINFNYGGRQEIVDASLKAAEDLGEHGLDAKEIDEEYLRRFVYVPELPDIDLLIRTAGEMRISNFMLWHLADAEIIISPVLWPDFRRDQLDAALQEYRRRKKERDSDLD
jgi:undecaprenyl diphosphate synthase